MRGHTNRDFDSELEGLRRRLLRMVGRVEEMARGSARAVLDGDLDLARRTILMDRQIDMDQVEIDAACLRVLARRQPMAGDLRLVVAVSRMLTDIERIGDLAVNLCERALELHAGGYGGPFPGLEELVHAALGMVHRAIDAFARGDAALALQVLGADEEIDLATHTLLQEQIALMRTSDGEVERAIRVQIVARYLERIADHATNLAEQVIFMVDGRDVRHLEKD